MDTLFTGANVVDDLLSQDSEYPAPTRAHSAVLGLWVKARDPDPSPWVSVGAVIRDSYRGPEPDVVTAIEGPFPVLSGGECWTIFRAVQDGTSFPPRPIVGVRHLGGGILSDAIGHVFFVEVDPQSSPWVPVDSPFEVWNLGMSGTAEPYVVVATAHEGFFYRTDTNLILERLLVTRNPMECQAWTRAEQRRRSFTLVMNGADVSASLERFNVRTNALLIRYAAKMRCAIKLAMANKNLKRLTQLLRTVAHLQIDYTQQPREAADVLSSMRADVLDHEICDLPNGGVLCGGGYVDVYVRFPDNPTTVAIKCCDSFEDTFAAAAAVKAPSLPKPPKQPKPRKAQAEASLDVPAEPDADEEPDVHSIFVCEVGPRRWASLSDSDSAGWLSPTGYRSLSCGPTSSIPKDAESFLVAAAAKFDKEIAAEISARKKKKPDSILSSLDTDLREKWGKDIQKLVKDIPPGMLDSISIYHGVNEAAAMLDTDALANLCDSASTLDSANPLTIAEALRKYTSLGRGGGDIIYGARFYLRRRLHRLLSAHFPREVKYRGRLVRAELRDPHDGYQLGLLHPEMPSLTLPDEDQDFVNVYLTDTDPGRGGPISVGAENDSDPDDFPFPIGKATQLSLAL